MEWLNILVLLACPLMMLFCMKGMFGGHKEGRGKKQDTSPEMKQLQLRMAEMEEQKRVIRHKRISFQRGGNEKRGILIPVATSRQPYAGSFSLKCSSSDSFIFLFFTKTSNLHDYLIIIKLYPKAKRNH